MAVPVADVRTVEPASGDAAIILEASERFRACKEWQGTEDERAREDIKFANGDARNAWQWPTKIYQSRNREGNDLPCLTINNTRVHNDLIINQISKANYGIKIRPTGGKSTYKSAEVMQNIIRRIEYISKFSAQKRKVAEQQVDGGIGYIIIETAYVSERSFDQDIYLKASRDPTGVYLDPWSREPDGSDANFGFVFERIPRKEFNRRYPKFADKIGAAPLDTAFSGWITDKEIMLAKYYRKKAKKDTLVSYKNDDGNEIEKLASEIRNESGKEILDALLADIDDGKIDGRTRKVDNDQVEWFLIGGDTIIDNNDWAGKYIPICRCPGREVVIDNTLDRKGMTRSLIDTNRMLNYNASMGVQAVALQPKSPWLASARAIEGQEQWKTANVDTFAVLTWNDIDDEAPVEMQKVEPPIRLDPPKPSPAYTEGMGNAERWSMMVSGQFQAQMGENDAQSAASGKAINERQQQGDTATYHFPEHQSDMLRFIGVQLLDLIPKIYDTRRTLHIQNDTGDKQWITIDPSQEEVIKELKAEKEDEEAVKLAFNPSIGEYECVSDPGPDYATQRQEAFNAMSIMLQQNAALTGVMGDLYFRDADFPAADKIAERLEKEIKANKPYLFSDSADPMTLKLQAQIQQLTGLNGQLMTKLADLQLRVRGKEERRDIEGFKADTDRMRAEIEALKEVFLTPAAKAQMEHDLLVRDNEHIYNTIEQANEAFLNTENDEGTSNGGNNAS